MLAEGKGYTEIAALLRQATVYEVHSFDSIIISIAIVLFTFRT